MSDDHDLEVGTCVTDRNEDGSDAAVVVNLPDKTVDEWLINWNAVADWPGNEAYPDDSHVAIVVFEDVLRRAWPSYTGDKPLSPAKLTDKGVSFYAYPAPRLEPINEDECDARGVVR